MKKFVTWYGYGHNIRMVEKQGKLVPEEYNFQSATGIMEKDADPICAALRQSSDLRTCQFVRAYQV